MSGTQTICHPGIVQSVDRNHIRVSIISRSACGSCNSKNACSIGDSQDKLVDIYQSGTAAEFTPGDQVEVVLLESTGIKALVVGYILPFLAVLFTLILLTLITGSEKIAGIAAIGILVPYYLLLGLFGKSLKKTFSFSLRKIETI